MKILLTGASGFIGRKLSDRLMRDGHEIVPVSRRHGFDFFAMTATEAWLPLLAQIDAVINAVGIIGETGRQRFDTLHVRAPIALFAACRQAGVRRVIQISALGADATAFSRYHLSKRAADDALRATDLDWFVLRPSLIHGGASTELFMRLARLPIMPVVGDGRQAVQPVHIADVLATVETCLTASETRLTLDIVGSETVAFGDWLQRLRLAQGRGRGRILALPVGLVMALVFLGQPLNPMLRPENIRMLLRGYQGDGLAWREFMRRPPLALTPGLLAGHAAQTTPRPRSTS